MVRLAESHDAARVDAVCAETLDLNRLGSGFIRERLKNGAEAPNPRPEPEETIPPHSNVRGGEYYRSDGGATP